MSVNDRIWTSLSQHGGGTINERVYNYLGSLGLTGTISDRLAKYTHNNKHGWQALIEGFGLSGSAGVLRQELFGEGQQGVMYVPQPTYLGQQLLYQDSAGTTPVEADGDPVGMMPDISGNGNHATAPSEAARPLYRTDGVLHWLQFDGVDEVLIAMGTASVLRFLHDGSENYMQVAVQGYSRSGVTEQLIGTGRVGATSTGARLYHSSDMVYTASISNGSTSRLSVSSAAPPSRFLEEMGVSLGRQRLIRNGVVLDDDGLLDSPEQGDSAHDFAIAATGVPDFFSEADFFGAIVHEGAGGQAQSRNYLANLAGIPL